LGQGDQASALTDLTSALALWNEIQGSPKGPAGALGPRAAVAPLAGLAGLPSDPAAGEGALSPMANIARLPSQAALDRTALWLDAGLFVFTAVAAIVIGLQALWLSAPTWGGWGDYLVAALWGLGMHKVAGEAFEGLDWIRKRATSSSNV
jgi:hypothetical protein